MDAQKNRDRFVPSPKLNKRGRPIVAAMKGSQPRVLELIYQHRTLTVADTKAIIGGNLTALYQTFDVLKSPPNEYIRPVPEQARWRPISQPISYELTPKGIEWLTAHGHAARTQGRIYNLGHTTLVSRIMASITAGIEQTPGARLVSWEEMKAHPKFPAATREAEDNTAIPHPSKGTIRPDTHPFGIEQPKDDKKSWRFIVIEADNGTETIYPHKPREYRTNSIYGKFEAYLDFIGRKGFHQRYGLPNYFALFVFTNQKRLENAMQLLGSMGGSNRILFALAQPDAPAGYLFTTPCERVGFPPLQLNQP